MNSRHFYKVTIILSLSVLMVDFKTQAVKIKARQSGSQVAKQLRRKRDGHSASENKLHFQSKMTIIYAIGDYEAEFSSSKNNETDTTKNKIKQRIEIKEDITRNSTINEHECRREIQNRKFRWRIYLENPPTQRIAKLKARVDNGNNQFTLDEFCQAVAILYQRIKDDLELEVREKNKSIDNPISKYSRTNFVIPFLLEDYPDEISKPVRELIANELQKTR